MEGATAQRIRTVLGVLRALEWSRAWHGARASAEYGARVARAVAAQVWREERQRLRLPTAAETEAAWHGLRALRAQGIPVCRLPTRDTALRLTVCLVEAYGFFKLGEVLGRRHLVGYRV